MPTRSRIEISEPRSILVVLPTWLGDFVMATPALRALRRRFPRSHIVFLAEPNLRGVLRGGEWMNECVEWPAAGQRTPWHRAYRDLVWDLRRRRLDWAILFPNSFRAALVARLAGAGRRIGYDRDGRGFLLTDRIPVGNRLGRGAAGRNGHTTTHDAPIGPPKDFVRRAFESVSQPASARPRAAEPLPLDRPARAGVPTDTEGGRLAGGASLDPPLPRTVRSAAYRPMPLVAYYARLAEFVGCDRPGDRLELFTSPSDDASLAERMTRLGIGNSRPLVVVSPGAKYGASKCWLPERFAAVADGLIEADGATVVVTCGPGEESIADCIAAAMRRPAEVLHTPLLTLGELKSLIRRADLLIATDSGPRHVAKAFGTPVVTLFGPTHPTWTATNYEAERVVRVDLECSPCQRRTCPLGHHDCMTGITVERVLGAARELLSRRDVVAV